MLASDIKPIEFLRDLGLSEKYAECLDFSLIQLAMMHSSYSVDNSLGPLHNNERLEFYGDSILKLACSKFLYEMFPDKNEGVLSNYRSVLVSDNFLAKYANDIKLDKYLLYSDRSDLKAEKAHSTIMACAFEALLAALFMKIGFVPVYEFLEKIFKNYIGYVEENILKLNAKAALQEYTQGKDKTLPVYNLVSETGKAHEKIFKVEVLYNDKVAGCGQGRSKKEAEQEAAYDACVKFGVIE